MCYFNLIIRYNKAYKLIVIFNPFNDIEIIAYHYLIALYLYIIFTILHFIWTCQLIIIFDHFIKALAILKMGVQKASKTS